MEGIAAIAVVFILFTVLAQAATALIAHRTAQGVVAGTAARVAITPESASDEATRLEDAVASLVPGASAARADVDVGAAIVTAAVVFRFSPPGPLLRSFEMEVSAEVPFVVEP